MVKIRLKRFGAKKKPVYRIVAIDSSVRRDGRPLEEIGFYDPCHKIVRCDQDKLQTWIKNGAQPSETVARILNIKTKLGSKHAESRG